MRPLRFTFCIFSFIAALAALAQHLGMDLWGCSSCSLVNELPISKGLAWTGPPVLAALTYAIYRENKWTAAALGTVAVGSLSLVGWMLARQTVCTVCMLVHIGVLSAALTLVPKAKYTTPFLFSIAIIFTATDGWDRFTAVRETGIFRPRDGEMVPEGKVYVLFSDPECGRCQVLENQIAQLKNPPKILYRWTLLPQNTYRSIRTVAMLESARAQSHRLFEKLHGEIRKSIPPLTDPVLISAAEKAGIKFEAKIWLEQPTERILIAIEDDQTTSQELKIESLPALAELSTPDATGTRTLRRVPFSTIGIRQ